MVPAIAMGLIEVGGKLIDRIFPDKKAADEAKLQLLQMQQNGELKQLDAELQIVLGQIKINEAEANSTDSFRAGWRPTIGYVLAGALGFQYIINPLMTWAIPIFGWDFVAPTIALDNNMFELMFGMLGLAGIRTYEKIKSK
jgi:hypothetical protein